MKSATDVLNRHFLEMRADLIALAATLDRIGRADGADKTADDPRLARIREAIRLLESADVNRAERVQMAFSLPYEPEWQRPATLR